MTLPRTEEFAHELKATDYLEGHVNCRCTLVPRAKSYAEILGDPSIPDNRPPIRTGAEEFAKLSPDMQRRILGPGKFDLYQKGVPLDAFVNRHVSSEWGASRVAKPLRQVMAELDSGGWEPGQVPPNLPDMIEGHEEVRQVPPPYRPPINEAFGKKVDAYQRQDSYWENARFAAGKKDFDGFAAEFVGVQADYMDDATIRIRRSMNSTKFILQDGRFKTQFEVYSSGGLFSPEDRAEVEETMFWEGLDRPDDIDRTKRPVYGYFARPGDDPQDYRHSADGYGEVTFHLKRDVRQRATYTGDDSLDTGTESTAVPWNDRRDRTATRAWRGYLVDRATTVQDKMPTMSDLYRNTAYVEAQVHDGVTLDDVDYVVFTEGPPDSRTEELLRDRGIRWSHTGTQVAGPVYDAGEEDWPAYEKYPL